jgi:GMP synthase-like glutamine amidotransferase
MRVHVLQHVPFEGLGAIEPWLAERSAEIRSTKLYRSAHFPEPQDVDWLIVMGGPMSVNDEDTLPWLAPEKRFIARAIEAGKTVLGVCLGAQLIAGALGCKVHPSAQPEIGWFPVEPTPDAAASPFAALFPAPFEVLHWHGQTFDLPPGAAHLARSAACPHQAFALGERVLALQYHLEFTPESVRALARHGPEDLVPSRWVQSEAEMLRDPERFRAAHRRMRRVLEHLAAGTG